MALNRSEADRVLEAAHQSGRILAGFQNKRYAPDFLKVRQVIESGQLGRIVMIRMGLHIFRRRWDWQTLKEFGGGEMNNIGSHCIDQALQLFGDSEPEIFCHLERTLTFGDAEDHCKIILHGDSAAMIDVEITYACAYPQARWLVMGTKGGLTGSNIELSWKTTSFDGFPARKVHRAPMPDRAYNVEEFTWKEHSWQIPRNLPSPPECFYRDLYKTLRDGKPLVITPQSVRRLIAVLEKCRQLSTA